MISINNLLVILISIFLPISLYQNYITYTKTYELKENSLFFELAILTIIILTLRLSSPVNILLISMLNIPIILLVNEKKYLTSIIVLLLTSSLTSILILTKYPIYIIFSSKKDKVKYLIFFFTELITLYLLTKNIISSLVISFIFIIVLLFSTKLLTLTTSINDYNKIQKELNREKLLRSSISKLTHELKNPIAVCNGYLEMLDLSNKEKSEKYISIISNEITRSKNIIDEFSNYGKLKTIDKEEMDLSILIEDIKFLLIPLFKSNNATLHLKYPEEIIMTADYNKLKQVLINLLKNTIEAKQEQLPLKVFLSVTKKKDSIIITLSDNGVGMSKETLSRISELFFTTKSNGTGIGISFSKEVIELHNGTFEISSTENIGTNIKITLPT